MTVWLYSRRGQLINACRESTDKYRIEKVSVVIAIFKDQPGAFLSGTVSQITQIDSDSKDIKWKGKLLPLVFDRHEVL